MNLTTEQITQLVAKYPYLIPRNVWTGEKEEDYDYSYIHGQYELPTGWNRLFLLLCKELLPHIVASKLKDKFYFTQIKEKYGTMRVYTSCLPDAADNIIGYYESFSKYVCFICGQFAKYYTTGWVAYYCENCSPRREASMHRLCKQSCYTARYYTKTEDYVIRKSFRPLIKTYKYVKNMTDEQFFQFLMED